MIDDKILKNEEKAVFALRSLYKQYGYLPFKMSKFEEYDLYLKNKDFLVSDRIITFNDVSGKLLALKPDVTLSIIKNTRDVPGTKQKVFYNENVYRVSSGAAHFGEIMQSGLECIGDIDITDVFEVCYLAAASLNAVSKNFVLDVSHMGVLSAILDEVSDDPDTRRKAIALIGKKNKHELSALCESEVFINLHIGGSTHHRVLENPAEKACSLMLGHTVKALAVEGYRALVKLEHSRNSVHKSAFSRAVTADNRDKVAVVNSEI